MELKTLRGSKPLYVQIEDFILEQIKTGRWQLDQQITTERELAEQFKVSRITAKNALNNLVNQGYLYRQRGKGTFVSNRKRQGMQQVVPEIEPMISPPSKLVGLIIPWMEFRYSSLLFTGIAAELERLGYHMVFKRIESEEMEAEAIRSLLELKVCGLVIVASRGEHFNDQLMRLALNKFPIVLVEKTMRDIKTNGVYCDTERVGTLLAEFLLSQNHRQFGLVTYPSQFTYGVKERIFGFQSALVKNGVQPLPTSCMLSVDPKVLDEHSQLSLVGSHEEIRRFIEQNPQFQAIATVDALLARFVGKACGDLGRHDMEIVCCDEPAYVSAGTVLPVAYVDQSPYEMGKIAAGMLANAVSEGENHVPEQQRILPQLCKISEMTKIER